MQVGAQRGQRVGDLADAPVVDAQALLGLLGPAAQALGGPRGPPALVLELVGQLRDPRLERRHPGGQALLLGGGPAPALLGDVGAAALGVALGARVAQLVQQAAARVLAGLLLHPARRLRRGPVPRGERVGPCDATTARSSQRPRAARPATPASAPWRSTSRPASAPCASSHSAGSRASPTASRSRGSRASAVATALRGTSPASRSGFQVANGRSSTGTSARSTRSAARRTARTSTPHRGAGTSRRTATGSAGGTSAAGALVGFPPGG